MESVTHPYTYIYTLAESPEPSPPIIHLCRSHRGTNGSISKMMVVSDMVISAGATCFILELFPLLCFSSELRQLALPHLDERRHPHCHNFTPK